MKVYFTHHPTPLGTCALWGSEEALLALEFGEHHHPRHKRLHPLLELVIPAPNSLLEQVMDQLEQYFAGTLTHFSVPLHPTGTPFQQQAWQALRQIPYGKTISYSEQALMLGNANLRRAVGQANHHNPISIIIPCHRVVAHGKGLGGFGSGVDKKRFLLDLENRNH